MLDYVEYLADILAVGELGHRVKAVQMLLSDGTITRLEERLNRLKKEIYSRIKPFVISGIAKKVTNLKPRKFLGFVKRKFDKPLKINII